MKQKPNRKQTKRKQLCQAITDSNKISINENFVISSGHTVYSSVDFF